LCVVLNVVLNTGKRRKYFALLEAAKILCFKIAEITTEELDFNAKLVLLCEKYFSYLKKLTFSLIFHLYVDLICCPWRSQPHTHPPNMQLRLA
jgi:hypothetical protein